MKPKNELKNIEEFKTPPAGGGWEGLLKHKTSGNRKDSGKRREDSIYAVLKSLIFR